MSLAGSIFDRRWHTICKAGDKKPAPSWRFCKTISSPIWVNCRSWIWDVRPGSLLITSQIFFGSVTAIDIDRPAISYAKNRFQKSNLEFLPGDLSELSIGDGSSDVVVCAHVYEHVPDGIALLREIHHVLKLGGVCYFAAGNRLQVMKPHYRLPFLSVIPKSLGHLYMRASGKGDFYYEKHLSYWGVKNLVRNFERIDYTTKLVETPEAFGEDYMLKKNPRLLCWPSLS